MNKQTMMLSPQRKFDLMSSPKQSLLKNKSPLVSINNFTMENMKSQPNFVDHFQSTNRKDKNKSSNSFASAMKALQEKYKALEQENQKLQQEKSIGDQQNKDLIKQLQNDIKNLSLKFKIDNQTGEDNYLLLKQENYKLQSDIILYQEQSANRQLQCNENIQKEKLNEEQTQLLQDGWEMEKKEQIKKQDYFKQLSQENIQQREQLQIQYEIQIEKTSNLEKQIIVDNQRNKDLLDEEKLRSYNLEQELIQMRKQFNAQLKQYENNILNTQKEFQLKVDQLEEQKEILVVTNNKIRVEQRDYDLELNKLKERIEDLQEETQLQNEKQRRRKQRKVKRMLVESSDEEQSVSKLITRQKKEQKEEELQQNIQQITKNIDYLQTLLGDLQLELHREKSHREKDKLEQQIEEMSMRIGKEQERLRQLTRSL